MAMQYINHIDIHTRFRTNNSILIKKKKNIVVEWSATQYLPHSMVLKRPG